MSNEVDPLVNINNMLEFGTPHHGLVRAGVLTKSDDATMDYPQPISGDTNIARFAGIPPVVRSPEQQAKDEAAHYEWRDYSLVGGEQLAGKLFGLSHTNRSASGSGLQWIYIDSAPVQWVCTLSVISWIDGIASLRIDYAEISGDLRTGFYDLSVRTGLSVPAVQLAIFNASNYGDKITVLIADAITIEEATEYRWIEISMFGEVMAEAQLSSGYIWLYRDINKSVWMCYLSVQSWIPGKVTIKLDFSRFGYISKDSGEEKSTLYFDVFTDLTDDIIDLEVADISPDGTKAVICISSGANANWVEIVLSGAVDLISMTGLIATPTVLKNKADCWASSSEKVTGQQVQNAIDYIEQTVSGDAWPPWTEADADVTKVKIDEDVYTFEVYSDNSETDELTEFKHIVWAFYDRANIAHFVSTRFKYEEAYRPSNAWSGGGSVSLEQTSDVFDPLTDTAGGWAPRVSAVVSGTGDLTRSETNRWEGTLTYEVLVDDSVVTTLTASTIREHIYSKHVFGDGSDYDTSGTSYDSNPPLHGGETTITTTDIQTVVDWNGDEWVHETNNQNGAPNIGTYGYLGKEIIDKPQERGERFHFGALFLNPEADQTHIDSIRVVKLSNKMVCLKIGSFAKDRVYYDHIIYPDGIDMTLFDSAFGSAPAENSSYQPETGDLLRNETDNVCYI